MRFRPSLLILLFLLGAACQSVAPTPMLIGRMTDLNNVAMGLYLDCSDGINYSPAKVSCDPELLETKIVELRGLSQEFISADITQPHGYDIHLSATMIYFRIGQRNLNEYTRAEQIARQFFEVQKGHSGRSVNKARFVWVWFASATAAKQHFEDPLALTPDRKAELLLAAGEGTKLLSTLEGPRLVRLQQALQGLEFVIGTIE